MSKFKVGDKVITPFGIGTFIEELEDLGWGLSVVQFGNSKGSHYDFELQIRNKDLKLYKTPEERLFKLGFIITDETNYSITYLFNGLEIIIFKTEKTYQTYVHGDNYNPINLKLAEILFDYLKELENE